MISKSAIKRIAGLQYRHIQELNPGTTRDLVSQLPYVTDSPLLIEAMRGSGSTVLLAQIMRNEYTDAWYTDFGDPRLAGFDGDDIRKLDELIRESGKGVLVFDRIDLADGWMNYIKGKTKEGCKVIGTVSSGTLDILSLAERDSLSFAKPESFSTGTLKSLSSSVPEVNDFVTCRLKPVSYSEFLEMNHKAGSEAMVNEYISRGSLPEYIKTRRYDYLLKLYSEIITHDVILPYKIRDVVAVQQLALHLTANSGNFVTANGIRDALDIKAVSTVADNMLYLQRSGLVTFLPLYDIRSSVRTINPRKVYPADTALAIALAPELGEDMDKLFETIICTHLSGRNRQLYYFLRDGACDFVAVGEDSSIRLVQACYSGEYEPMQVKIKGLLSAMRSTGADRGTIVTMGLSERYEYEEGFIDVIDADTFLGEDKSFF